MKNYVTLLLFTLISTTLAAQEIIPLGSLYPATDFENIHVQKLNDDSLSSTFLIWVKERVKEHYHADHTEVVYVLEGEGQMKIGDQTRSISEGDYIFIPKGTPHAVEVKNGRTMKVISIQSPHFDGSDRIFLDQE